MWSTTTSPYLTDRHCTPWGEAINYEGPGSDEVRRFFCDNAIMWMRDYHIDGLRLDAIHEIVDRSAIHFLEQLSAEVEVVSATLGGRFVLIAESDLNDPRVVTPREAGGLGMDAQWSDDFHHALFTLLHMEQGAGYYDDFGSFEKLVKSLMHVFVYDGAYSKYRNRRHGRPVNGLSAHHFIGFIQNHDQVGNRATGDRLAQIVGTDCARIAAGLVLTAPFVPMLFQGEEYAADTPFLYFADHEDPEMAKAVSEGRKREFAAFKFDQQQIPDPEAPETFQRAKLNWSELDQPDHADMLEWYRALIHLRRHSPSLNDGDLTHSSVRFSEAERWLAMDRGQVQILCNLGDRATSFPVPAGSSLALSSRAGLTPSDGNLTLPPRTLVILSAE
jgi:maltooligosyltrehalose trehalohydrolase